MLVLVLLLPCHVVNAVVAGVVAGGVLLSILSYVAISQLVSITLLR